jgi:hypothetical protein
MALPADMGRYIRRKLGDPKARPLSRQQKMRGQRVGKIEGRGEDDMRTVN